MVMHDVTGRRTKDNVRDACIDELIGAGFQSRRECAVKSEHHTMTLPDLTSEGAGLLEITILSGDFDILSNDIFQGNKID